MNISDESGLSAFDIRDVMEHAKVDVTTMYKRKSEREKMDQATQKVYKIFEKPTPRKKSAKKS